MAQLPPEGHFGWKYYTPLAVGLSCMGFASGYTWYVSLAHTPVAGNTALYQTAPVLVFLFSVCMLKEKVTIYKVAATLFCVGGTLVVSFSKTPSSVHNLTGTSGAVMAAAGDGAVAVWGQGVAAVFGPLDQPSPGFLPLATGIDSTAAVAGGQWYHWFGPFTDAGGEGGAGEGAVVGAAGRQARNGAHVANTTMTTTTTITTTPPPITREGFGYMMCFLSTTMYVLFLS